VLVSVFGVIFAPDASAAAREMARVAKADGRLVLSAWRPGGPLAEVMRMRGEALDAAAGTATAAPAGTSAGFGGSAPFAWHEPGALDGLLAPHGFSIELHDQRLAFAAASPSEFVDTELRVHPAWVAARAVLEPRGEMDAVRARCASSRTPTRTPALSA
jgi:SAM-dependent methyltransferase